MESVAPPLLLGPLITSGSGKGDTVRFSPRDILRRRRRENVEFERDGAAMFIASIPARDSAAIFSTYYARVRAARAATYRSLDLRDLFFFSRLLPTLVRLAFGRPSVRGGRKPLRALAARFYVSRDPNQAPPPRAIVARKDFATKFSRISKSIFSPFLALCCSVALLYAGVLHS